MEILTWCDPKYFKFADALIRSIRYNKNENLIHLNLMDFNDEDFDLIVEYFREDSKINLIRANFDDLKNVYDVNNRVEFYRNYRPRLFLDLLKKSENGKLCTFGANGLVFCKLRFIKDLLNDNDFIFLERQRDNVHTNFPKRVAGIDDIQALVEGGISIDKILSTTTGKVVLLGTHAMRSNDVVEDILQRWINMIENTDSINNTYSDMNLFVKSCVQYQIENNTKIKKQTGIDLPREENPFCDTLLTSGSNIWFAKGSSKFNINHDPWLGKYLELVEYFRNYKYKL
tara:strand:- start:10618 stop:11475 length:858 start_codon:yes stop_codon:yes gene_type:complete